MSTHEASTPGDSISTASPAGSTLATSMSATSSTQGDAKITCRWKECSEVFDDPEDLYVHLCNAHVGRKSTNNLCLTCGWDGCNVTCAKRDHITSHLRVHTPLKPHACETCNKLFKRPQDLKKHERIHTEQHQQVRQAKFQSKSDLTNASHPYERYAQNAADSDWSRSHMHSHPQMAPYHAPLYPNLPGSHHTPQQPSYSSQYGMARRDLTPVSLVESTSSSSLSPLSSHIATPAGSSPAALHHYSHGMPQSLDRGYLNLHNDQSRAQHDYDPNSYSYLAQGSNVAGTKRGHDAVATASFFDDIKRKKVAPTYDSAMATRIEDTFANGIDDASLQALLASFSDSYDTSSSPSSSAYDHQQQQQQPQARGMSLPEAFKQTDLADLNAFLLEVGANAAREADTSASATATPFDFMGAINSYGLNQVPGFDESIFQFQNQDQMTPSHPNDHQWNASLAFQRPIAQLPHRSASVGYPSLPSSFAPTYPAMSAYTNQPMTTSFDSIRTSRGPSYVPQLAPKEMNGSVYRHVEPLTRAEPMPRATDSSLRTTSMEPRRKVGDADMEDAASTPDAQSPRSSSPASPSTARSHVDKSPKITYPRLGVKREDSMDGIEEDVAAMDVNSKHPIPSTVRRNHAMIILDLLRAINFPRKQNAEESKAELKLAPILSKVQEDEDMVHTPTRQSSEGRSDESKQSTPKIVSARNLPRIASLLN